MRFTVLLSFWLIAMLHAASAKASEVPCPDGLVKESAIALAPDNTPVSVGGDRSRQQCIFSIGPPKTKDGYGPMRPDSIMQAVADLYNGSAVLLIQYLVAASIFDPAEYTRKVTILGDLNANDIKGCFEGFESNPNNGSIVPITDISIKGVQIRCSVFTPNDHPSHLVITVPTLELSAAENGQSFDILYIPHPALQ